MPREVETDSSSAGIQSPEPITEGSLTPELVSEVKYASDALSEESVCSKCGGSKPRGVKAPPLARFVCRCRQKPDEENIDKDEENIPLQDCPETDAAVQEIGPIQEPEVGDHSPAQSSEPSQADNPPVTDPPVQRIEQETTGCAHQMCGCMEDQLLVCNWSRTACFFVCAVVAVIIIAIALDYLFNPDSYSGVTNSTFLNSTVGDI